MGVNVSKNVKEQSKESAKDSDADKNEVHGETETEKTAINEHNVRLINNGEEVSDSCVKTQNAPVVVKNIQGRPKFYYYPNRKQTASTKETIFLTTSQFPFKRPKAVVVRPRKKVADQSLPCTHFRGNEGSRYSRYENSLAAAPDANSDHAINACKASSRPVNDRFWSSSHPLPTTNNYSTDRILPHRTVLELRRSSLPTQASEARYVPGEQGSRYVSGEQGSRYVPGGQYSRHTQDGQYSRHVQDGQYSLPASGGQYSLPASGGQYSLSASCGQYSRHAVEIEPGVVRPPTPSTIAWLPYVRTDDCLVASSLLTSEREMDRRQTVVRDDNGF